MNEPEIIATIITICEHLGKPISPGHAKVRYDHNLKEAKAYLRSSSEPNSDPDPE